MTLVGSMFSTAMGFALVLVLATRLGAEGSGVVLQTVASFMIGLALARLGMDTTAVWVVPRLKVEDPGRVREACLFLVASAALAGGLVALAWWATYAGLGDSVLGRWPAAETITAVVWAMPVASTMLVALAATRGFGGVLPFNLVGNIAVPLLRPVSVLVVTLLGGGVLAAAIAWSGPWVLGAAPALGVLAAQVRRFERRQQTRGRWRPRREVRRRVLGFALPRTLSSALEQSIIWFDVVLVGVIAGSAAAGVYGAASRFVGAGVVVLTALRIVVAPRFSALLAQRRNDEVQRLYTVTAGWILLLGSPVYVVLGFFGPTVLGLLGPDFAEGAVPLAILCGGALLLLAGGNIQSLLLMSGRSGWGAFNKATVFGVNVVGNVLLVPDYGIVGAASVWAFCMGLDTTLAMVQVYRFTGIRPALGRITAVLMAVVACAGLPSWLASWLWGNTLVGLAIAVVLTGVLLAAYAWLDRRRLHLGELRALLPGGRAG